MIPTLIAVSMLSFLIIQAPAGDYADTYVEGLRRLGQVMEQGQIDALRDLYGLNDPIHVQYLKWASALLRGDLGRSFAWNQPVKTLLLERLPWTILISLCSLLVVYMIAIPIGTASAVNQYSVQDYVFTTIGFIGLAVPNFLFALIFLWLFFLWTGNAAVGLFSREYLTAPWSIGKFLDLLSHLWIPALIVGTAGTASLIRIMRANMLDELQKPYVMVARSKGLSRRRVLYKYPFRMAINPMISTIGWMLPTLFGGELLVSLVLNIPTISPLFVGALLSQDMFLAGSIVMIVSSLTVIGTLISDIALGWVDPRIREAV
jgi:peptide/nickel transport system permease protein